jgi:hypothetical protein
MFDHTDTIVVLVDFAKGRFAVQAEQLDGKKLLVATEARWDSVKKHLADARTTSFTQARITSRAEKAVKKQMARCFTQEETQNGKP